MSENFNKILRNNLKIFNEIYKVKIEFDTTKGGIIKLLKIVDDDQNIIRVTKSKAIDIIKFLEAYLDKLDEVNKNRPLRVEGDSKNA